MRELRIAVADDEPDMREYYSRILPRLGHAVVAVAATGNELVERCRSTTPDLVISDVRMPDVDGIEAAAELNRGRRVPVILVTALREAEALVRASGGHVVGYLTKPVRQAELGQAIARAAEAVGA